MSDTGGEGDDLPPPPPSAFDTSDQPEDDSSIPPPPPPSNNNNNNSYKEKHLSDDGDEDDILGGIVMDVIDVGLASNSNTNDDKKQKKKTIHMRPEAFNDMGHVKQQPSVSPPALQQHPHKRPSLGKSPSSSLSSHHRRRGSRSGSFTRTRRGSGSVSGRNTPSTAPSPSPMTFPEDIDSSKSATHNSLELEPHPQEDDISQLFLTANLLRERRKDEYGHFKHVARCDIPQRVHYICAKRPRKSVVDKFSHMLNKQHLVRRSKNKRTPFMSYGGVSFGLFSLNNRVRNFCIDVIDTPAFDNFILISIVVNSIFLAFDNPLNTDEMLDSILLVAEITFTAIFTVECILKLVAMGAFQNGSHSYFRDHWNTIDFLIVLLAYVGLAFGAGNMSSIRLVRLLRPLRSISTLPGLRLLVESIIGSLPMMSDVFLLFCFILFLFGIAGMQLFGGELRMRCLDNTTDALLTDHESLCRVDGEYFGCPVGSYCGDSHLNPNDGVTHFDNILVAFVAITQATSLEGWADLTYLTWEATSYWSTIYFLLLILLVAFFLLQLITGVVFNVYMIKLEDQKEKKALLAQHERTVAKRRAEAQIGDKKTAVLALASKQFLHAGEEHKLREEERKQQRQLDQTASVMCPKCREIKWIHALAFNEKFDIFIMSLICINTLVLATEHYEQPSEMDDFQRITNIIFTIVFLLEAMIKTYGLGLMRYLQDGFNRFDLVVVLVSLIEIFVIELGGSSVGGLSVLRSFRLLRVFKLTRRWKALAQLVSTVAKSFNQVAWFSVLLLLFIFMFSLLGMQLMAGKVVDEDGVAIRSNFDDFFWSCLTVFQIIGGENWNDVMNAAVASVGWEISPYFLFLFLCGNYLVLNLFLAILLSNFEDENDEGLDDKAKLEQQRKRLEQRGIAVDVPFRMRKRTNRGNTVVAAEGGGNLHVALHEARDGSNGNGAAEGKNSTTRRKLTHRTTATDSKTFSSSFSAAASNGVHLEEEEEEEEDATQPSIKVMRAERGLTHTTAPLVVETMVEPLPSATSTKEGDEGLDKLAAAEKRGKEALGTEESSEYWVVPIEGVSLYVFSVDNRFRQACAAITNNYRFEAFIMGVIFVSVMLLIVDTPGMDPDSALARVIVVADYISTSIFTLEAVLRIIAMGFVFNDHAYLRDWWNDLDLLIVVFSWMDKAFAGISWVKAFRALRSLRPLRVVSRNESLMVVIQSIVRSIPGVMNVFIVSFVFFVVFGILGVQLFAGLFKRCETVDGDPSDQYLYNRVECEALDGYVWTNPDVASFDHIAAGLLTLFALSTMEMWPEALYRSVDISSENEAPIRDNTMIAALYWVVFVVVVNFFISNLFVGMIVDTFVRIKTYVEGSSLLTASQQKWLEVYRLMYHTSPSPLHRPRSANRFRMYLFDLVTHTYFETFIGVLICLNVLVMSMYYYDASDDYKYALEVTGHVFGLLFLLEMIVKIIALKMMYLADGWNVFDGCIVAISVLEFFFFVLVDDDSIPLNFTMLRTFRLFRMVRLLKRSVGLQKLVRTIVLSIPALINIGGLLLLLFIIFATAGMALFGNYPHREFLNEHANFDNFGFAMFTLFRCATGESWNGIMTDLMPRTPGVTCDETIEGDCGSVFAVPYFVVFTFCGMFVMVNLFIAVLLDEFVGIGEEHTEIQLTHEDLQEYASLWLEVSGMKRPWYSYLFGTVLTQQNLYLEWTKFREVVSRLTGALSLKNHQHKGMGVRNIDHELMEIHTIKISKQVHPQTGRTQFVVHYADGLLALARRSFVAIARTNQFHGNQLQEYASNVAKDEMEVLPRDIVRLRILENMMSKKFKTTDKYRRKRHLSSSSSAAASFTEADDYGADVEDGKSHLKVNQKEEEVLSLQMLVAVLKIQSAFRGNKARKQLRELLLQLQQQKNAVSPSSSSSSRPPKQGEEMEMTTLKPSS